MARRVLLPSSAGGSGILNPNNALVADGSFASIPTGAGVSQPLILTGMINGGLPTGEGIAGVEAIIRLGYEAEVPSDGIDRSGFGQASWVVGPSYGGTSSFAPETWDGDPNTFFWSGSNSPGISVSVIHDLGSAKSVAAAKWSYSAQAAGGVPGLHYSSDLISWTHVTYTPGGGPGLYYGGQAVQTEWVGFTPVTARYWRMGLALSQSAKIREFWLYSSSGVGGEGHPGEGEIGGPG